MNGQRVPSRATGIVDAPGNLFVCVLIEAAEIWIIDASQPGFPITHRIPTKQGNPYDAMITPDGRYYVVGHMKSDRVSVLDLTRPSIEAAMFTMLPPGGELGAHHDPFAGSLRYHLGLVTPNDDACWIEVSVPVDEPPSPAPLATLGS